MDILRQQKETQKIIWLTLTIFNLFLLLVGSFAYYYDKANTTIKELTLKVEQQNITIEQQQSAQSSLIASNQEMQKQLEEVLQASVIIEEESNQQESQLSQLSQQNQQLTDNIKNLTSQIDELTKLNEQYVSERSLSVKELETKYRTLVSDAETKVTQLDTEIVQKQTELQQYYDQINSYFYIDDDLKIKLVEEKSNNQHYWVAEVITSKNKQLQSEFANNTYGGTRETLSSMANRVGATLAINASGFYTDTNKPMGSIVRDGQLLQTDPNFTWEVLSTTWSGDLNFFQVDDQASAYAADINDSFAFGPILVRNGVATEIKDTSRHPRTAIGQLDENRYIIVVAEGRLQDAEGLTLTELQNIFLSLGCQTAYNLDGGGSTTLYFKGKVINTPSDGAERAIADMIYF